jgi:phage shock protein A
MNILAKMLTALKGGVNEVGEAVIDGQALRILDQELREASDELHQSKDALANIIARQKLAEEKCAQLHKHIAENESYARRALEKGEEALALEVAQKIADLENQVQTETDQGKAFEASANDLRSAIKQAEQNLRRLKQQVDTIKATDSVQRAQAAVAEKYSGTNSKMRTAMDSLERIKEKQALKSATMKAAAEVASETDNNSLHDKLRKAGIVSDEHNAQEVLDRLKNQK